MKTLLVHPGTQYSFRLAAQLQRLGCLGRFWTGVAYTPSSALGLCIQCLPKRLQKRLSNRRLEGVSDENLRTQPFVELRALHRLRANAHDQTVLFERNAIFQRQVPTRELAKSDVIIGFDTSSWLLAGRALGLGRPFLLDRSIGHPLSFQRLSPTLGHEFPDWVEDLQPQLPELLLAQESEHEQAHRIIVASSFTQKTLIENGVPAEKISINPYGVDLDVFSPVPRPDLSRPVRFMFLGHLGVRKGVPLLLQAFLSLKRGDAELWLVGAVSDRNARLIPAVPGLRVLGRVPHRDLPGLLCQCDVLVFPSYFEGFGLVLLEALAAGLPIIATDATAAPDLITHGVEGYLLRAGDSEALRDAMQRIIDSPGDLERMSLAARVCAERYSWDTYGDRWMDLLQQVA